jgi:NAD(P)H-hydrate repair Nnr-like enzyme with NAD(P)H-hydrate dehydratase domain
LVVCSCILTPNKPEFERLIEATIQLYTSKLQQGAADEDRSFNTALLRELCLVESDKPASHSASNSHMSLGGMEGAPSTIAVRRVNALSAALGGVTIMRKVQNFACAPDV